MKLVRWADWARYDAPEDFGLTDDLDQGGTPRTQFIEAVGSAGRPKVSFPDPRYFAVLLWRRKFLFLLVAALILGAVAGYISVAPKRYTSTGTVKIVGGKGISARARSDFIDTQIRIVHSPQIAALVVKALNLADDPEFGMRASSTVSSAPAPGEQARMTLAVQNVSRALAIRGSKDSTTIAISASSLSPVLSARIANEVANQYLASIGASKVAGSALTDHGVSARLLELQQDAARADAELQQYKAANDGSGARRAGAATRVSSTLDAQIAVARADLAEKQGRLAASRRQLSPGASGNDVAGGSSSTTVAAMRQVEAEEIRALALLKVRYGDRHPDVLRAEQKLADTRRQLQLESSRAASGLDEDVTAAQTKLSSLLQAQSQLRSQGANITASQIGLVELSRRATAAKALYRSFLASSKQPTAPATVLPPVASLAAPALIPRYPSSPDTRLAYWVGAAVAVLGGLAAAFLAEFLGRASPATPGVALNRHSRSRGAVPLGSEPFTDADALIDSAPMSRRERFDALYAAAETGDGSDPGLLGSDALERSPARRQFARQARGSSAMAFQRSGLTKGWRISMVVGFCAILGASLAAGLVMIDRSDPTVGPRYSGILPGWFTGKGDGPPTPVPAVEPLVLMDVTPQTARQLNDAVPFVVEKIAAARPFQFVGTPADREAARKCLAAAVYYEAGDSPVDQYAVAQVVINRARHPAFPKTICGVVFQGAERSTGCQFTFACDGSLARRRPSADAWARALRTADASLSGFVFSLVGNATHYHTDWVFPYWQADLDKIAQLRTHIFYRWRGWWGTPKAFSATVRGTEYLDPRVAAFAGAGDASILPAPEVTEAQSGIADIKTAAPTSLAPVSIPGVPAGLLKGNFAYLVSESADVVVLKLQGDAFPGSFAVVSRAICGDRQPCLVVGYLTEEQMPKSLPLSAETIRRADFMYRRGSAAEQPEMRWNCAKFPRSSPSECRTP